MISRREFLRRSGEAGAAIGAASAGLGSVFAEVVNHSTADELKLSDAERRAQRSFEIRCDCARAATREKNPIPSCIEHVRVWPRRPGSNQSLPRIENPIWGYHVRK
jgi:hypothetical protein